MTAGKTLAWGLTALRIDLASEAQERLMQYAALIQKWNRTYNLTAVQEEEGIVTHHLLDSLAVSPHIGAGAMVDVGSGAGLPGIPLAIARPERSVTLLEASQKKAAFLRQAIIELALNNASVACERVETWHVAARFDIVVSRAFSDLRRFVELAGRLCGPQGIIAAMRGRYKREDSALLPDSFRVRKVIALEVPGLDAERHLVLIAREA